MPFGISPAPEHFQHRLDQAIEGLAGMRTVADDILITGEGDTMEDAVQDHDRELIALLERFRGKGVKLNREKFKLKMTEIPYVGHVITRDGVKPDPSKIDAIQNMSRPTDVKGGTTASWSSKLLNKILGEASGHLRAPSTVDPQRHRLALD